MNKSLEVSLIGAKTYGTLAAVFQMGTPYLVSPAVWDTLKDEVNPATGEQMFCLTADLPPEPEKVAADLNSADLKRSGLLGEIDTGSAPVVNTVAILQEEDELPAGASDDAPSGEVTVGSVLSDPGAEDQNPPPTPADPATDSQSADTAPSSASKKITIGGKSKPVTV